MQGDAQLGLSTGLVRPYTHAAAADVKSLGGKLRGFTPVSTIRSSPTPPTTTPPRTAPRTMTTPAAIDDEAAEQPPTVIQPNEPCQPGEILRRRRRGEDGRWFDFGIRPFIQFYAYSAFWDDRESTGFDWPLVRIIAVSTSSTAGVMTAPPIPLEYGVRCRFHLNDGSWLKPVSAMEYALPIGYGWWLNDRLVREFIYNCPAPNVTDEQEIRPDGVTILVGGPVNSTELPDDPERTACVPVEYPEKPAVKGDFAVCVQVAYGNLDPLHLIEWMELQRILGVELVGIYNLSITEGLGAQVLRYYSKYRGMLVSKGFVELRRSDYIADGPSQYLLHGSPVINDCMYHNMYRFRHIVVVDFDEAIIPQSPWLTLHDAISQLERIYSDRENPPVNYIFPNNYFFTDFPPAPLPTTETGSSRTTLPGDAELALRLRTLRYRWRAPLSGYGQAVKSIVDPQACRQVHNHYCWGVTLGYEMRGYIEVVPDTIAVNQHYKRCHFNATECANELKLATVDSVTMARHWDRLVANVAERIREIFGMSPSEFLQQLP